MRTKLLEDVADKLTGNRNPDDLYLALHAGKLTTGTVARTLAPQLEHVNARREVGRVAVELLLEQGRRAVHRE